jgi:hypothetical protein
MTRPYYLDVIEGLNKAGVRYTVVGGVAVILHGAPRMTGDLDLAVILEEENLLKFVEVIASLGYRPRVPVDPRDLAKPEVRRAWKREKGMKVFTFFHPKKPFAEVDILIDEQVPFEGIWKHRKELQAKGTVVPIASIGDLVKMKEKSARDKDLADIAALNRIRAIHEKEGKEFD